MEALWAFLAAVGAAGDDDHVAARVAEFRAAGVDDILLCPQVPAEQLPEQVARLAEVLRVGP
jgi:alkanesulfonate monooxygenase SsuD/methylene tetrahydromethanopterin reductase-like flavin-dependent oxidoreductase (luciferase family)